MHEHIAFAKAHKRVKKVSEKLFLTLKWFAGVAERLRLLWSSTSEHKQ